ncbi:hypothetical protein JR316_0011026 [Psilocybe cubensis]|uniref:Uncharacterized protein n=2 Tax=Psilocybe cubensis TaxID=181762 RepID=A0A8H7XPH2_PSICU|nr:hypothetical protein JR316_0011026 [Psilocybe cubensis]KAH9477110.1 hypothetical protein JR316_0011026 [Psilocybe cubensis]
MPLVYESKTTLQSIPPKSPVVPHGIAYIGGVVDAWKPQFVLLKNNREFTIQAPPLEPKVTKSSNESEDEFVAKYVEQFQRYLAVLECLLSIIDFDATDMAYMIEDSNEDYQIIPGRKALRNVSCPLWMHKIYVDEVNITVWGSDYDGRRGIWEGKEVDISYALHKDLDRFVLNRAMQGLRALEGRNCDLLFEVYGHLVDRDETIVGLVTEAAKGRVVTPDDKDLIQASLKALEHAGCVYTAVASNHFLITDGKLRLLQLNAIIPYPDQEQCRKEAAYFHDWALDELIEELREYGKTGRGHGPPGRLVRDPYAITYLRFLPPPERPLRTNLNFTPLPMPVALLMISRYLRGEKYPMPLEDPDDLLARRKQSRKNRYLIYRDPEEDCEAADKQGLSTFKSIDGDISPYRPARSTRIWRLSGRTPYTRHLHAERGLPALSSTEGIASITEVVDDVVKGKSV